MSPGHLFEMHIPGAHPQTCRNETQEPSHQFSCTQKSEDHWSTMYSNCFSLFLKKETVCFLHSYPQTLINDLWFIFVFQILAASTENRHESHRSSGRTAARPVACTTGQETFAFLWGGAFHSCRTTWGRDDSCVLEHKCACVCFSDIYKVMLSEKIRSLRQQISQNWSVVYSFVCRDALGCLSIQMRINSGRIRGILLLSRI